MGIVTSQPVHYQDAHGQWQTIDDTVVADCADAGYAYGNKANGWHVHFARQSSAAKLVHAQFAGASVAETLDSAAAVGATTSGQSGQWIVYPNVFPGVDLQYGIGNAHLEEQLLLHNAQVPASFSFTYHVPGAHATQDPAGDVVFTDAHGTVVLVIGAVAMYETDTHGQPLPTGAGTDAVALTLAGHGPDYTVTLTPDHAWLTNPARTFPVVIDPTWSGGDGHQSTTNGNIYADTFDESANPTPAPAHRRCVRGRACSATAPTVARFAALSRRAESPRSTRHRTAGRWALSG